MWSIWKQRKQSKQASREKTQRPFRNQGGVVHHGLRGLALNPNPWKTGPASETIRRVSLGFKASNRTERHGSTQSMAPPRSHTSMH